MKDSEVILMSSIIGVTSGILSGIISGRIVSTGEVGIFYTFVMPILALLFTVLIAVFAFLIIRRKRKR